MAKDSMYPGADEEEPSPTETPETPEKEGKEDEGESALLPKSFFEGQSLKPGQQYYVEIVREYESEVEVRYPHEVKGEEESGHDKLDAMGTEMGGENPEPGY
jgi:hypothetical protein